MRLPDPSFWRGRKIFLTGHTGFKGSWATLLLHYLGAKVTGYSLPQSVSEPDLFHAARVGELCTDLRGDIRDLPLLVEALETASPDFVIHMAAQPIVRLGMREPVQTFDVNVMGTVKLLDAIRVRPSARVVCVVTSDKCYENRERVWAYREDEAMGGKDPYSASKGAAEIVTSAYARTYFGSDKTRVITGRAGNVIGGGDWAADRLIPDLARAARDGTTVEIRSPGAVRPWQHVLDPVIGYLVAIEHTAQLEQWSGFDAWNFGPNPGEELTVREIVEAAQPLFGGKPAAVFASTENGAHKREEAGLLRVDNTKAKVELRWLPGWGNLEALTWAVDWYRAVLGGADPGPFTRGQLSEMLKL